MRPATWKQWQKQKSLKWNNKNFWKDLKNLLFIKEIQEEKQEEQCLITSKKNKADLQ